METGFVTWDALIGYAFFVSIVFMLVEFTKEWHLVKKIRTKHYSAVIAFSLLIVVNLRMDTFILWDLVIYALSAVVISFTSNGLSDYNNKVLKHMKDWTDDETDIDENLFEKTEEL